jgi:hypothetical protein
VANQQVEIDNKMIVQHKDEMTLRNCTRLPSAKPTRECALSNNPQVKTCPVGINQLLYCAGREIIFFSSLLF